METVPHPLQIVCKNMGVPAIQDMEAVTKINAVLLLLIVEFGLLKE
jgi:hypothetical protein